MKRRCSSSTRASGFTKRGQGTRRPLRRKCRARRKKTHLPRPAASLEFSCHPRPSRPEGIYKTKQEKQKSAPVGAGPSREEKFQGELGSLGSGWLAGIQSDFLGLYSLWARYLPRPRLQKERAVRKEQRTAVEKDKHGKVLSRPDLSLNQRASCPGRQA